jgi:hypothetical protein
MTATVERDCTPVPEPRNSLGYLKFRAPKIRQRHLIRSQSQTDLLEAERKKSCSGCVVE